MLPIEDVKHLQIPLQHILFATNGFADQNLIGKGGFGNVYEGKSEIHGHMAIKRLVRFQGQGDHEFMTEIALLSTHKHENIVSLLGFCDEDGEKILVYKYKSNGSLDRHLSNKGLTWIQRLGICLDAARGLKYLHDDIARREQIFHRDVKSSNILLDENWNPKISDFGLSRVGPVAMMSSYVISNVCGTPGYIDPNYHIHGYLSSKSDVYSFGVVLWEVLCGRLTCVASKNNDGRFLTVLVQKHYNRKKLGMIIPPYLRTQMNTDSLDTFSNIAYRCLTIAEERPTMQDVVEKLQEALHIQLKVEKQGKKPEEETEATVVAGKKGEESQDPPPPIRRQEFAFKVFMHCNDCARKVRKCLKPLDGVERVETNCETHMVVVKGEKADPLKVIERIRKETKRKVELLPPISNPNAKGPKNPKQEEPCNRKENKDEKPEEGNKAKKEAKPSARDEKKGEESIDPPPPPPQQEFALKVSMCCEDFAGKIQQCLKGFEGVEDVLTDCNTNTVIVKGTKADPFKVLEIVQKNISRKVELLSPVPKVPKEDHKKPKRSPGKT